MKKLCCVGAVLILSISHSFAQLPQTLSYQGFLESNGQPVNGNLPMTFRLYTQPAGGTEVWTQSFSGVVVTDGLYAVVLDVPGLSFDMQYWLETEIGGQVGPTRTQLTSVPYSLGPWSTATSTAGIVGEEGGPRMTRGSQSNIFFNNGNVGIGTSTPTLLSGGSGKFLSINDPWSPGIALTNTDVGGNQYFLYSGSLGTPNSGHFGLFDATNNAVRLALNNAGDVGIGTQSPTCRLDVHSGSGDMFHLTGYEPFLTFFDSNHGNRRGAIQQNDGGLNMFTNSYLVGSNPGAFLRLDDNGNIGIGAHPPAAKLDVKSGSGDIFHLTGYEPFMTFYDANHGYIRGAIQQVNGGLNVFADSYLTGTNPAAFLRLDNSGNVGIGVHPPAAKLDVAGRTRTRTLEIIGGSDLAEPFDMEGEEIEPGTVMVIDDENSGRLRTSDQAYDSRVAGIISGAGGVNPGLTLSQEGVLEGSNVVAIAGRVYCKAEAFTVPIRPGDLLTTSSVKGHAMKARHRDKAHGAVIGKAMTALHEGTGLVLVLVNLQ